MAQMLQAPTEGYEDAIVVPVISADNFELKHGLLTLVQNKSFFGHDIEDPHAHIRYFNKITSTLNSDLAGKEPPRSIFSWDDLVSKFINQFFPPSKTTNLRNEITNFQQRFDESFSEACDRFKDLFRVCPHHGFLELHQLDTFYNALNLKDQDSLNSAAGVVAKVSTNTSTSGISPDVAELKDMVKALLLDKKTTDGNVYRNNIQEFVSQASAFNYNQGNTSYRPPMMSNQICPPGFPLVPNNQNVQLTQRNNQNHFNQNQNQGNNFNNGPFYHPSVFQPPSYQAPAYQAPAPQTQELSDHLISCRVGVAEDVHVKVGSFYFSVDFVVVDFDADPRVPLTLKRSFFKTKRPLIDVFEEAFLNDDPSLPPPTQGNYMPEVRKELKICEAKFDKSSIDEPPEVELKDLPPYLEYAFLESDNKFLFIIAKYLSVEEKTALITVLKSHKQAIAWKLSDIKGIDPEFCTHKILMEEDFKP
uniref:Reverse transcriptase domain-containing protein n=1 Tax=Tanacetum cinerariifolium TaxID=118510 RepID=A0A699HYF2_TANCI|nr:reverse transcriptase domain-containing protein [Tanacetum cinerariifolium]